MPQSQVMAFACLRMCPSCRASCTALGILLCWAAGRVDQELVDIELIKARLRIEHTGLRRAVWGSSSINRVLEAEYFPLQELLPHTSFNSLRNKGFLAL